MTGTSTAAARNTEANAYTGNYASQSAGAAYNNQTGAAAAGVHTTQGNAYTGQQVSATKGVAYNPNTGQAESVGAMGSDGNYVAHAGNNVYAEEGRTDLFEHGGRMEAADEQWRLGEREHERLAEAADELRGQRAGRGRHPVGEQRQLQSRVRRGRRWGRRR